MWETDTGDDLACSYHRHPGIAARDIRDPLSIATEFKSWRLVHNIGDISAFIGEDTWSRSRLSLRSAGMTMEGNEIAAIGGYGED